MAEQHTELTPSAPSDDEDAQTSPAATARAALKILTLFSAKEPLLRVSDIGQRLQIHKSKASRLALALAAEDFLTRTASGRYCLGSRLYSIGLAVPHSRALLDAVRPELYEIRVECGESVHLAVLLGNEVVYLERLHANYLIKHTLSNSKVPLYATSVGKLLLAHAATPEVRDRVIAAGLKRFTPKTITDPKVLLEELAAIRARGYAMNNEEFSVGVSSIAVPVFSNYGQSVAAMAVVAPTERLSGARLEVIKKILRKSTARIGRRYVLARRPATEWSADSGSLRN